MIATRFYFQDGYMGEGLSVYFYIHFFSLYVTWMVVLIDAQVIKRGFYQSRTTVWKCRKT